ncbi:MAG TPA: trigger factor [Nitrospiria bacterium]
MAITMKYAVEEISSVKRSLKIEVPVEIVAREIATAYSQLNQRIRIPGFRPGKAPLNLLEKRYASTVEEDVIRKLVPDYYRRAIQESGLRPIELPTIENVELKKDTPLSFTAMVEIVPIFDLARTTELEATRPSTEVSRLDIDRALEALQEQQAQLTACPEDHLIADKDFVVIDFTGTMDGKPLEGGSRSNHPAQIGSGGMIPGFEEQLINHRRGDRLKVHATFPKDYSRPELAGRAAEFEVTIREIKQKNIPVLDDEFAKDMGPYPTLEDLKTDLKGRLEARAKQEADRAVRSALIKQLNEAHRFEVPAALVEREIEEAFGRLERSLPKGVTMEQAKIDPAAFRKEIEPSAREKVKGRLILRALAEKESLAVTAEELDAALARTALELQMKPEDVKRLILAQEGTLDVFKERLLEDKALDWVVSKAVIR